MKYLALLYVLFCSACAVHRPPAFPPEPAAVVGAGTTLSSKEVVEIRTPETVKAYPVGRYTDPNFPNEMHERHKLYRREEAANWNYEPSEPYALPLGPTIAESTPSPSNYLVADTEEIKAQQQAYADSLGEQNRALQTRLNALLQEEAAIKELKSELEQVKRGAEALSKPDAQVDLSETPKLNPEEPQPSPPPDADPNPQGHPPSEPLPAGFTFEGELFRGQEPLPAFADSLPDPFDLTLFPEGTGSEDWFLFSQMQLNDDLLEQLAAAELRRVRRWMSPVFLSLYLSPLNL